MSRQVKIDGQSSDWYESAIFVVKDGVGRESLPRNIASYAEELLEQHMKVGSMGHTSSKRSYAWIDQCFWLSIGILAITCVIYCCI